MASASPFNRLRMNFVKAQSERWVAQLASVGSAVLFVGLLLLVYLFTDLMVWKGTLPSFSSLAPTSQVAFSNEWATQWTEAERAEAVKRIGIPETLVSRFAGIVDREHPPTVGEWEVKWQANTYLVLRARVSLAAAEIYADRMHPTGDAAATIPKFGSLSLVLRKRSHWTGPLLGWFASWNPWTWSPGTGHDANPRYLAGLFILAFLVALVRGLCLNAMTYFAAAATLDTVLRIRRAIYFHTFRLGSLAIRTAGIAEPVELFTRRTELISEAVHAWLISSYRDPIAFVLLISIVLLVNFWLGVSFLVLGLLVWVIAGQVAAYFRMEGRQSARSARALLDQLQESMSIIRLVKCYQMERFNQNRVERQLAESERANWRRRRGDALSRPLLFSAASMSGIALLYLAGRSVLAGDLTVAGLVVMGLAILTLFRPISGWLQAREAIRSGREAAASVFEFLDRKGEAGEASDAEFLPALTTRIEFRQVSLRAPGTGRMILDNISFAIPAGTRVAIVGPDDNEKRALLYLLPRFLDPTTGEIRVEDKNIRWVTHESLRAQVAVVMQNDLVFGDTVLNNIGCGDPSYNLPQVIEAAKLAHAHQFIERLPHGYETIVGDQGFSLRLGERFRIALARAVLRDPSILIIEEPSGPIDEDTLALLDDTLDRISLGRTIIFLAHRVSTLRSVDRIFLLRNGIVEASGHHRELWQGNESYRRLSLLADSAVEV